MTGWLSDVLSGRPGAESEFVERYTMRLLDLARQQLPERVRRRVDPEDVVQSVYRSFFRRLNDGRFTLDDSHDVWRLLAAMTFHKARTAVRRHQRERRDVRREQPIDPSYFEPTAASEPDPVEEVEFLVSSLEELLSGLNEKEREVVARRLDGDSIEAIASGVGRSRRTVLRILARVRELAARSVEAP